MPERTQASADADPVSPEPTTGGRIGLIAGAGGLPVEAARRLRAEGVSVAAIAFEGISDPALEAELAPDALLRVRLGQLAETGRALASLDIERVLLLGKVPKTLLFEQSPWLAPDAEALELLGGLASRGDEPLMGAIATWLESRGLELASQREVLASMLTPLGPLSRRPATPQERADLEVGRATVSALGRVGVGQCAVVKQRCVLAVEAIEGTDAAIRRAGELGGPGATVVKAARPGQDLRFDLPAVGPETLRVMRQAGATALGLEAGASLLIDSEAIAEEAERAQIAVFGFAPSERSS